MELAADSSLVIEGETLGKTIDEIVRDSIVTVPALSESDKLKGVFFTTSMNT